jgi:isochorismate synthase/2-succinyl-5-enolpyruvyl-6-hydroxy-3-cyclohexene-1-carboxylate synthase/2-succinyl-6-hydroxy-2,4-cyclohexadiene-1-carboxylate synthase/O-succinylbenzoate synthase
MEILCFFYQADDSSPTLLFLHGLLGTGHEWLPVIRPLSSSFRCIAVDLPGHGTTSQEYQRSNTANKVSMELVCNALVTLLEKLGIKQFVPVGYSMGARIALYLALRHSERVCLTSKCKFPAFNVESVFT